MSESGELEHILRNEFANINFRIKEVRKTCIDGLTYL